MILGRHEHVGGLDVAVDEPAGVGGVERGGDLADDPHRAVGRELALVVQQVERSRPSTQRMAMKRWSSASPAS